MTPAGRAHEWHACAVCLALQRFAIRRRDLGLIAAAEQLSAQHLANEVEHRAFTRRAAPLCRAVLEPSAYSSARG